MTVINPLSTLEVVNGMLGLLGERGINDLDDPHPMLPDALSALQRATTTVQADFWWFNVEYPTLTPQENTGYLLVPNDAAGCDSLTQYPRLAVRGNRLYDLDNVTDVFTCPLRVRLHRIVPFDECPVSARQYISTLAKLEFITNFDGDSTKIRLLQQQAQQDYVRMHAEHIRNAKSNLLYKPTVLAKLANIVGGRTPWQQSSSYQSARFLGG